MKTISATISEGVCEICLDQMGPRQRWDVLCVNGHAFHRECIETTLHNKDRTRDHHRPNAARDKDGTVCAVCEARGARPRAPRVALRARAGERAQGAGFRVCGGARGRESRGRGDKTGH